jgi:hypothetical protein
MKDTTTTTPRSLISAMQVTLDGYSKGLKARPTCSAELAIHARSPPDLPTRRPDPHLVLSTTLTGTSWPSARIVRGLDEIRTLKQQPGEAVSVNPE